MHTIRLFSHHLHAKLFFLGLFEMLLVVASVYAAGLLYFWCWGNYVWPDVDTRQFVGQALLVGFVAVFSMQAMGLYHRHLRVTRAQLFLRVVLSFAAAAAVLAVLFYIVPALYLGRGVLGLATALALVPIMLLHELAFAGLGRGGTRKRVLIYGAGHNAASILARMRRRSDWISTRLLGCVAAGGEVVCVDEARLLVPEGGLAAFAASRNADEIIVAMDDRRSAFPVDDLLDCRLNGIAVTDMLTFYERSAGKIKTDLLRPSWIIFSDGFSHGWRWRFCKRVLDVGAALLLLLATWPVMLVTWLLIKWEDGWRAPVLYRQVRVGQHGREYTILKFRSMSVNAESGKARWASRNDSRVTRVGRYLRKYRIDELPQLINVVRGDMSFVGPRPERPEFVGELAAQLAFYNIRHRVKPGITGWAQLSYPYGSSPEDALEKLQYDLYYVKNGSLFLDLVIILGTVEVVLFRKGAR